MEFEVSFPCAGKLNEAGFSDGCNEPLKLTIQAMAQTVPVATCNGCGCNWAIHVTMEGAKIGAAVVRVP